MLSVSQSTMIVDTACKVQTISPLISAYSVLDTQCMSNKRIKST